MRRLPKILITGADGFIGSHLTEALVRVGYEVRAFALYDARGSRGWLDRLAPGLLDSFEIRVGDIRDGESVSDAVRGCEIVVHLAALIGVPYSYASPASYVDTNVNGTLNLLLAARDLNVEAIIHTSSSEVYGCADVVPIGEEHPLRARSPYSASKIAADQLALSFHASFGLPLLVLRPFNTYGPRQSARAVIPTVIAQLTAGHRRLRLGSLHPTRDFTYVDDCVAGFLAAIENAATCHGEVINIGSGFEVSIRELVGLIAEVMAVGVEIDEDRRRVRPASSEVQRLVASNAKAADLLGWSPTLRGREGLLHGLRRTTDWFANPANFALYDPHRYAV